MKTNIIILEDDFNAGQALKDLLENKGFECHHYTSMEALLQHPYSRADLYILDYHLEGRPEGSCAAQTLRNAGVNCPIIMLTSETDENVIIGCFKEANVDDYLNKPVRIEELSARLDRHLSKSKAKKRIIHNQLTVDVESESVFVGQELVDITHSECRIIQCLLENKGRILQRQDIIEYINKEKIAVGKRTIDTQINTIRNKICESVLKISSKRSIGYGVIS